MPRILRWLAITPPQAGFKPASTETLRVLATLDDTARAASSLGPWLGTSPSATVLSSLDFGSRRSDASGHRNDPLAGRIADGWGQTPALNCSSPLWTSAHVGAARPGAAGNFYIIAATEFRRRGWPEGANEWH